MKFVEKTYLIAAWPFFKYLFCFHIPSNHPGGNENEEQPEACPHLLDYEGLVQVVELIERIKGRGESKKMNQTEEGDYDVGHQKVEKSSEVQV